jgi:hypothetical protein
VHIRQLAGESRLPILQDLVLGSKRRVSVRNAYAVEATSCSLEYPRGGQVFKTRLLNLFQGLLLIPLSVKQFAASLRHAGASHQNRHCYFHTIGTFVASSTGSPLGLWSIV